jgi:predicted dinucleotide-binding enzyme
VVTFAFKPARPHPRLNPPQSNPFTAVRRRSKRHAFNLIILIIHLLHSERKLESPENPKKKEPDPFATLDMASSSSSASDTDARVPIRKRVAILGLGPFAQGLASLIERSGGANSYEVVFGSRRPAGPPPRPATMRSSPAPATATAAAAAPTHLPNLSAHVLSIDEALKGAHIVILALPASAFPRLVAEHAHALAAADAIVDVSNPSQVDGAALCPLSAAERLRDTIASAMVTDAGPESLPRDAPPPPVVKAFNTLSAYALLHGDPLTDAMRSVVAGDDVVALGHVKRLGAAMGVDLRGVPSLAYARRLERRHDQLFLEWRDAWGALMATFLCVFLYSILRYNGFGGKPWVHVIIYILNKAVSWVALWGMGYAYAPGIIITTWQLVAWRKSVRAPRWLKRWLDARKQLGLLSLLAVALHLALSIFLWMPAYFPKLFQPLGPTGALVLVQEGDGGRSGPLSPLAALAAGPSATTAAWTPLLDEFGMPPGSAKPRDALHSTTGFALAPITAASAPSPAVPPAVVSVAVVNGGGDVFLPPVPGSRAVVVSTGTAITLASKLNWRGELSTLLGVLAGFGMALTGMTSAPSVTPKLGWREWRLMQSRLGWASLVLGTSHILVLGAPDWVTKQHTWPKGMPTITLISTAPVLVLLAAKLLLSVPPLSVVVKRARRTAPPSADAPAYAV